MYFSTIGKEDSTLSFKKILIKIEEESRRGGDSGEGGKGRKEERGGKGKYREEGGREGREEEEINSLSLSQTIMTKS